MLSRIFKGTLITFGLTLVLLILTCPSDNAYFVWLEDEYQIKCVDFNCKKEGEIIDWQSRGIHSTGIYNHVEDNYRGPSGERIVIRVLGILGHYFEY